MDRCSEGRAVSPACTPNITHPNPHPKPPARPRLAPCRDFILSVAAAEEEERQRAEAEAAAAAAAALRRPSRRVSAALLQSLGRSRQAAGGGKRCARATSREGCHGGGAALPGPASHASFLNSLTKEERRIIGALPSCSMQAWEHESNCSSAKKK